MDIIEWADIIIVFISLIVMYFKNKLLMLLPKYYFNNFCNQSFKYSN